MFDLETHPLDEAQVERSLTPAGSLPFSYEGLVALITLSVERAWVVQAVEAYEREGEFRRLRTDATCSYPRDEYSSDPIRTARECSAYIELVLGGVADRANLIYEAWIDPQEAHCPNVA